MHAAAALVSPGSTLAFGEPAYGCQGWRLTHHQARATAFLADPTSTPVRRYRDVALLAATVTDDLLSTSLEQIYLTTLSEERDGGRAAKETLTAYFAAEFNVSSAASALGVKRHTVTNRLRTIEARIGRRLGDCAAELQLALELERLGVQPVHRDGN